MMAPRLSPAQGVVLSGFVTDAENGQPLPDANVVVQNDAQAIFGAISNGAGFYQLVDLAPGRYILQASFIGYAAFRDTLQLGSEDFVTLGISLTPTDQVIEEILVTGEREGGAARVRAGMQKVRPRDIERIPTPGPSGDLATYLQTLPGVITLGDRGGQLFIRGGTPSQNLILVDGMLIYNPFHILGFFSAFPEELVSNVDVFAGGFGAEYSGRMSSVIDVTMRGGNNQRYEGGVSLSPFLSSARIEGPIQPGKTSILGSFRLATIEDIAPTLLGEPLPMAFNDWFVKMQYADENSRCSGAVLHTYDRGQIDADRGDIFRWVNTLVGGQCVGSSPGSRVFSKINTALTHTSNAIGSAGSPERAASAWRINIDATFVRPTENMDVRWGFYGRTDDLIYDIEELFVGFRSDDHFLIEVGGHVGISYPLTPKLTINPSLAISLPFSYSIGLEPRMRLSWQPRGRETEELNAAVGLYRQNFVGINDERDAGSVFTVWLPSPLDGRQAHSIHALLGWTQRLSTFDLSVEGYYKRLKNLPVPIWSTIARFTTDLSLADGHVYGADFRVEYELGRLYGYVGYGYSWIQYAAAQDNFGLWFGSSVQKYHPPHDRRHQLNAVASLDLGRFTTNLRWQFGSPLPYTKPFGFDSMVLFPGLAERVSESYGTPRILYDRPYGGRLPTYHRLDISAEYEVRLGLMNLSFQAGAINVYGRTNLFYYDVFTLRRVDQLPFTPYVGINVETR